MKPDKADRESAKKLIEELEPEKQELPPFPVGNKEPKYQEPPQVVKAPQRAPVAVSAVPKNDIEASIIKWANHYGVDPQRLLRIARCESGYNPLAVNYNYTAGGGHPTGLFQYLPETWTRYQRKAGLSGLQILNYEHQAQLTAYAFSIGGAGEWQCR